MRALLVFWLALALGACAADSMTSYVVPLQSDDALVVAGDIAAFVADQMPAGAARIAVYSAGANDTFAPKLITALKAQLIAVESGKSASAPDVHQLRYQVDPLDRGELVRIELDGRTAAELLVRGAGGSLEPAGPFAIRTVAFR